MTREALIEIFERDLNKLLVEIESYEDEKKLWAVKDGIKNSAGNLCLHLMGNLNHFIGAVLGKTGYERSRELEFSLKNIPRSTLIKNIESTKLVVENTLSNLTAADFDKTYAIEVFNKSMTTGFMLIHLATHLSYHLGQINYHRRLVV